MNVVYSAETTPSGMKENRVVEIGGKFYPYRFDAQTGDVRFGKSFAKHTEEGVKYVTNACKTLEQAIAKL